MGCIGLLAQQRKLKDQEVLSNTTTLVIGTTLSTNCILEKKGAKCCLLYTEGFRDIPELGRRIPKDEIYNLKLPAPESIIPRYLRFGIKERIQFNGEIVTPLDEKDVLKAVKKMKENVRYRKSTIETELLGCAWYFAQMRCKCQSKQET
jgi:N-methylhydantoinase A